MRCIKSSFIIFFLLGASQFVYGDDHGSQMQAPIPVEFWGCEFNDGKTMDDLMPVIKEWKKTMGKQAYVGWVMTPTFVSEGYSSSVGFTGWWPDWSSMGKTLDHISEKVAPKMDPKWAEVITCETHMIATGITTRTAENEDNDSAVMNYSQCTLNDGKTPQDVLKATGAFNKFLDKIGVTEMSAGILFPGTGAPDGADHAITFWVPSMTAMGDLAQKFISNGGPQVQQDLFGDLQQCNNGSQFSGSQIY